VRKGSICGVGAALLSLSALATHAASQVEKVNTPPGIVEVRLGQSEVALTGPWRFHIGDDPRWSEANFDDSGWEIVDLTPLAGAHDSDVGLTNYVPGWTARGHSGYSGWAWYRLRITIDSPSVVSLALAGPPDVDDAYQLFFNGHLLGNAGDFSRGIPVVYSIQPRMFNLPNSLLQQAGGVVAVRVWMGATTLADAPDVGGIHIAPAIGMMNAVEAQYKLQWLETIRGYIVDAIEPVLLVALAVMAFCFWRFERSGSAYLWLSTALLLTALVRVNQVVFFWGQIESAHIFDMTRNVLLIPLGLFAWTTAWCEWLGVDRTKWIARAAATLATIYMVAEWAARIESWRSNVQVFEMVSESVRLIFVLLLCYVIASGIQKKRIADRWLTLLAIVLISAGLFAQELSDVRVPGIWFPFGTGVSRTQFAYAGFIVVMFALLFRRALRNPRTLAEPITERNAEII
jgi:hypothetical protein